MTVGSARLIHVPYLVGQDEDSAWCASAQLRPGVGAVGEGLTREAAVAKSGLALLIDETGVPDELTITQVPSEAGPSMPPRRIDHYDDPGTPQASSLVPAVNVVVTNHAADILMIRRTDNGNWALPGGAVDLGESVAQAAVRETREETGIQCAITGTTGIYSDPRHVILYTSNGEVRQEFSIVLLRAASPGSRLRAASQARSAGCQQPRFPGTRWTGQCASASTTTWRATTQR